jgi:KaiC/GvpD/RAD55 family RecA-like ATPase
MIPTGFPILDDCFEGGILQDGELFAYVAPANRGKTTFLLMNAYNCAMQGYKCLFLSGETHIHTLQKRFLGMVSGVPMKELRLYKEKVDNNMLALRRIGGKLAFKSFLGNSVFTPMDLEKIINDYKNKFNIDIVFVDSFDLMKVNPNIKNNEYRLQLAEIYRENRNISLRTKIPIITVSHTNRSGSDISVITEKFIGEDFTKLATCDKLVSINSTIEEYKNGKIRLFIMKNRDGVKYKMIEYNINFDSMTIIENKEVDVEDFNPEDRKRKAKKEIQQEQESCESKPQYTKFYGK